MYNYFEKLIDQIPDACFVYITEDKCIITNQSLINLFKYPNRSDFARNVKTERDLIDNKDIEKIKRDMRRIESTHGLWTNQCHFKRKDGSLFYGRIIYRKFLGSYSLYNTAIYCTINEEKNGLDQSLISIANSEFVLKDTDEIQVIIDPDGNIKMANHKFFTMNLFVEKSIKNLRIYDIVRKDHHGKLHRSFFELINGISATPSEYVLCNNTGKQIYVELFMKTSIFNNRKCIIISIREISRQKEVERKLAEMVVLTEETERHRFGEEILDELGPFFSGLKLYIDEIGSHFIAEKQTKLIIDYLKEMSDEAVMKVKAISKKLMSMNLMDYGLSKALEIYIEKLVLPPALTIQLNTTLLSIKRNHALELLIYRIVVELINNTVKHAKANEIYIELNNRADILFFLYKDNGIGYDIKKAMNNTQGLGLHNIINRIRTLQGTYSFAGKNNKGSQFTIQIPLN